MSLKHQVTSGVNHRLIYRWYGLLHRADGPAVEWRDGGKVWYQYGKRHREDGPAVEYTNGTKEWWINGIEYTKEEYESEIRSNCK